MQPFVIFEIMTMCLIVHTLEQVVRLFDYQQAYAYDTTKHVCGMTT